MYTLLNFLANAHVMLKYACKGIKMSIMLACYLKIIIINTKMSIYSSYILAFVQATP